MSSGDRRSVLIPLGASTRAAARIAYVHADGVRPANEAKLIPEIALLNDCRLYPAGTIALAAIRKLKLRPQGFALASWLGSGGKPGFLSVSNAPDLYGLNPENSSSAQLGLALALLMYLGEAKPWVAIATGRLGVEDSVLANGAAKPNVSVLPIGLFDQKIEAVGRLLEDYKGTALASEIHFFFPAKTETGESTSDAYGDALETLRARFRSRDVSLKLCPVSSLNEALAVLGIDTIRRSVWDKVATVGISAMAAAALFAVGAQIWLSQPIPLAFAKIAIENGSQVETPLRVRYSPSDGALEMTARCKNATGMPVFVSGDRLLLRAHVTSLSKIANYLGGYRFTVVVISEISGVKVYPPESWTAAIGANSTGAADVSIPITAPKEENKVIVLARRILPFDTQALRHKIAAAIEGKAPADRINAAVNILVQESPGYLDYSFMTVEGEPECL